MAEAALKRTEAPEWGEVQRVILRAHPKLPWAQFLLLRVVRRKDAARFLDRMLDENRVQFGWGEGNTALDEAAGVALTAEGLSAFGVDAETLKGFAPEFVEGMTGGARPRILQDVGDSAPESWLWGNQANPVHLVLMLYAKTEAARDRTVAEYRAGLSEAGLEEVRGPGGEWLGDTHPLEERREHFGFADGISQPRFRDAPRGLLSGRVREIDRVATGEILLGYENEAGLLPRSPRLSNEDRKDARFARRDKDFGRNGSYLVFRQLEQDVAAFWRSMSLGSRNATIEERVHLASKMVGRWPDGTPLATRPDPRAPKRGDLEDFDYAREDPDGLRCPFGAHIRRSNPRATLARDPEMGIRKSKKHRILRRGRSYGLPFVEPLTPEALVRAAEEGTGRPGPRGLHFLCFNADIANQFEFVQQTWINGPVFMGLHGEVDPLVGDPGLTGGVFTIQAAPVRRRVCGLPRFVRVRGGAYFFAPSQAALRYLSRLT